LGQVGVLPFIAPHAFLGARTGLKPIDHTSALGLSRTRAALETAWLLAYMFATMGLGMALNIHNHIHFGAFADGTQSVLGRSHGSPRSSGRATTSSSTSFFPGLLYGPARVHVQKSAAELS
jgi:hypothetical protein